MDDRELEQSLEQIGLRLKRIEKKLGLETGYQLIECQRCHEIKTQPWLGYSNYGPGICLDCIKKEKAEQQHQKTA